MKERLVLKYECTTFTIRKPSKEKRLLMHVKWNVGRVKGNIFSHPCEGSTSYVKYQYFTWMGRRRFLSLGSSSTTTT